MYVRTLYDAVEQIVPAGQNNNQYYTSFKTSSLGTGNTKFLANRIFKFQI